MFHTRLTCARNAQRCGDSGDSGKGAREERRQGGRVGARVSERRMEVGRREDSPFLPTEGTRMIKDVDPVSALR